MKKDDLNGKFHNLYDEQMEFEVRKEVWDRIEIELFPKKKRNGIVFWLSIFIGVIILSGTWIWNNNSNSTTSVANNNNGKQAIKKDKTWGSVKNQKHFKGQKYLLKSKEKNAKQAQNSRSSTRILIVNKNTDKRSVDNYLSVLNDMNYKAEKLQEKFNNYSIESLNPLPNIPISSLAIDKYNLKNFNLLMAIEKRKDHPSRLSISAGLAFGKNVRFTNNSIDPELSVTKHGGDNRMALNMIQFKSNFIYGFNDNYSMGIGANYGVASRRSPWYNRPTYFSQGQQELSFQTLEGRYTITDTTLLNTLAVNDTNNITLKNNVSIKIISIPITFYRQIQNNNWTTNLCAGISTDIHFGKEYIFEIEQNNISRQLIGLLDLQKPTISVQGLVGARFSHQISNSMLSFLEPQLSIPLSSYLSENNQRSFAMSLTFSAGFCYKF